MPEVEVSVIIPCYNRWNLLPEVLSSIISQTFCNWEVILVNDASKNDPPDLKLNEKIRYFRLNERRGSGFARNFGAGQSNGKFILFVDDDVVLSPTYIANLLRVYSDHEEAGAVGGRLLYVKNGEYYTPKRCYDTPVKLGRFSGEVLGGFNRKTPNPVEVSVLHAISLFKKEDFLSLGGFEELTYLGNRYREETDLFIRIRKSGHKLIFCPAALAYHINVKSGGQRIPLLKNEYYVLLNHSRFLKKFYSNKWGLMLFFFVFRRFYDRIVQLLIKTTRFFYPERWRKFSERLEDQAN